MSRTRTSRGSSSARLLITPPRRQPLQTTEHRRPTRSGSYQGVHDPAGLRHGLEPDGPKRRLRTFSVTCKFVICQTRMPCPEQFHVPPGAFLGNVFGTVVSHIITIVNQLDPRTTVALKPCLPNVSPRLVQAIAPQRADMVAVSVWILLQGVEIRHASQQP